MLAVATVLALEPGLASGKPCDGSRCVPNMRTGAAEGAACLPRRLAPFGIDASGNALICLARFGVPSSASWSRVPHMVGVRDYGIPCAEDQAVAQSPDFVPLRCWDSIWQQYLIGIPLA